MRNKLTSSINIFLEKAKIILFSDHGFDLVLKLKDYKVINYKSAYKEEKDTNYQKCDMYINIGQISLIYYENSLKKTKKFTLFNYKDIKLFSFNESQNYIKNILKFPDILDLNLSSDIAF